LRALIDLRLTRPRSLPLLLPPVGLLLRSSTIIATRSSITRGRRWRRWHELRRQVAADISPPDRAAVRGVDGERRIEARHEADHVVEVAEKEVLRARAMD